MDIIKARFKGFVEHVRIMILELLCALNGDQIVEAARETVDVIFIVAVETVAEIV